MVSASRLTTASECVELLKDVLVCLDKLDPVPAGHSQTDISLAAAHVQQAIELIEAT